MQKKSLYFLLLKLLKFPLGILTLSLTVRQFGVSLEMDSWLIALAGITTLGLALWGAVNETFRSRFVMLRETEGEDKVLEKVRSLLFYIAVVSLVGMVGIWNFPQVLANVFSTENLSSTEILLVMLQILAPYLLLNQCVLICTSILNAYEIYYIPEISSAISQIINIVLILLFAEELGIYVLVIALYISALLLLLFLLYKLYELKINIFQLSIPNIAGFREFFLFSIPFFVPYFLGQLNGMVEKRMATNVGVGAVSVLDFSKRIPDILNGVIISMILTILVPTLTKFYVNNEKESYQKSFLETYQLGLFCLIGFVVFFFVGADDIFTLLYDGGKVSQKDMQKLVYIGKLYAISLFGVFSYIIFGMTMLSTNKGKIYALYGSLAQIISIIMNFCLVDYLGIVVFPITFFASHFISAIFMFSYYPYEREKIIKTSVRYYFYCLVCCLVVYQSFSWSQEFDISMSQGNIVWLFTKGIFVLLIMLVLGKMMKIEEINKGWDFVQNKIKR